MANAVVKLKDSGWNQIEKEILAFKNASILIGFQEGTVTKPETKGQRQKKGGLNMAQIAAQNEFGSGNVPARPFMSTSFDENKSKIQKRIIKEYNSVIDGKLKTKVALGRIGIDVVEMIQEKIRQIQSPPLSPYTIKQKGSSKPLIDFGQMIQSVREKVIL